MTIAVWANYEKLVTRTIIYYKWRLFVKSYSLFWFVFHSNWHIQCIYLFFWLTRLRMNIWFFPGGLDVDVFSNGLISEELARGCAGIGGTILNNTLGVSKKLNGKSYILKLDFIKHYRRLVISSVEKDLLMFWQNLTLFWVVGLYFCHDCSVS